MPDPLQPGPAPAGSEGAVLASDRERDLLVERLSAACADGRLDLTDFSDRLESALSARTMAEIHRLDADLGQATPALPASTPGTSWLVGIMSSAVRKGRWVLQPQSRALAVMGECVLDLRAAEVLADFSHITAVAVMGSIQVIVPDGIDVDVDGVAIMGTKTLRIGSTKPLPGSPTIRVTALAMIGEVSVITKGSAEPADRRSDLVDSRRAHLVERRLARHEARASHRLRHWGGDRED
ncbi:MAG TPA: DUF1707 domain-containing protein [Candidatus Dormibacteraeota bacterium]|nr:DUF1707 domain-containing protein [Candidatus Dormibacteraeota bacterium]